MSDTLDTALCMLKQGRAAEKFLTKHDMGTEVATLWGMGLRTWFWVRIWRGYRIVDMVLDTVVRSDNGYSLGCII